jgi:hypothetical protein
MARRTFDVIDVTEILVHWHAGRSLNEMSGSLGVDRKTRKYIAPAVAAGIVPGSGPARSEEEWAGLVPVKRLRTRWPGHRWFRGQAAEASQFHTGRCRALTPLVRRLRQGLGRAGAGWQSSMAGRWFHGR